MNMCFLEVAMCEKCRSINFQSEGEVKRLRTGGGAGVKKFRTGGYWGVPMLGGRLLLLEGVRNVSFSENLA